MGTRFLQLTPLTTPELPFLLSHWPKTSQLLGMRFSWVALGPLFFIAWTVKLRRLCDQKEFLSNVIGYEMPLLYELEKTSDKSGAFCALWWLDLRRRLSILTFKWKINNWNNMGFLGMVSFWCRALVGFWMEALGTLRSFDSAPLPSIIPDTLDQVLFDLRQNHMIYQS